MPFDVGDKVVYPHHGAATIEKREKKEAFGKKQDYLVLRLAYGDLTLMVPADNAEEIGLRDVINDEEVEEVFAVLRKKEARMPTNWSRRFKNHVEKLKSGDIYQVAEVVRNLTIREKDKGLSAGEKRMLGKARQILVSELTFALNVDEETAEDKLDEVLGKPARPVAELDRLRRRRRADQGAAADHAVEAAEGPEARRSRRRPAGEAKAPAAKKAAAPDEGPEGRQSEVSAAIGATAPIRLRGQARPDSRRSSCGLGGRLVCSSRSPGSSPWCLLTAVGFMIGQDLGVRRDQASRGSPGCSAASSGYLVGGLLGRLLERAVGVVERSGRAGADPAGARAASSAAASAASSGSRSRCRSRCSTDPAIGLPAGGLVLWLLHVPRLPRRVAPQREELFAMIGLSTRPLVRARPYDDTDGFLVDSSAVMDGQLLPLCALRTVPRRPARAALRARRAAGHGRRRRRARSTRAARPRDARGAPARGAEPRATSSTTRCPRSPRSTPSWSRSRAGSRCGCSRTTSTWRRSPRCRAS